MARVWRLTAIVIGVLILWAMLNSVATLAGAGSFPPYIPAGAQVRIGGGEVHDIAYSQGGKTLAVGSRDDTIFLWNTANLLQPNQAPTVRFTWQGISRGKPLLVGERRTGDPLCFEASASRDLYGVTLFALMMTLAFTDYADDADTNGDGWVSFQDTLRLARQSVEYALEQCVEEGERKYKRFRGKTALVSR